MNTELLKNLIELGNDSLTALLATLDSIDYVTAHGFHLGAILRLVAFLLIFVLSNYLIRTCIKDTRKEQHKNPNSFEYFE